MHGTIKCVTCGESFGLDEARTGSGIWGEGSVIGGISGELQHLSGKVKAQWITQ